jgi:hypothetical protein
MRKDKFCGKVVMSFTFLHMIRAIDISLRKTVEKLSIVEEGPEGTEVLKTLSKLNSIRRSHVKFMESNPELFDKNIKGIKV